MPDRGLTHLDPLGRARMVDVTPKDPTHRRAAARGRVHMKAETTSLVARGAINKGDVLAVARVAGIQAAKRTPELFPLCHPMLVGSVLVHLRIAAAYIGGAAQSRQMGEARRAQRPLPPQRRHPPQARPVIAGQTASTAAMWATCTVAD